MGKLLAVPALLLCLGVVHAAERVPEEINLIPPDPADFGLRNVGAAITSVLGGWNYWYGPNEVLIDTAPSDARIDLFYVRSNFQKMYVRSRSPVLVRLPSRIRATPRDTIIVRVNANGFRGQERSYKIGKAPKNLVLTLEPLPNSLVALSHAHIGSRTTLTLRTTEKPEFRVMKSRGSPGFSLVLAETANGLPGSPSLWGGFVRTVEPTQIGEDLILRVSTNDPDLEVRSKISYDPVHKEHLFILDLTETGTRPPSPASLARELSRVRFSRSDRCNGRFERVLREGLEPRELASAFRSSGSFADLYRRQSMLALGRLDHGRVETLDGERFRTGSPFELEAALQSGPSVRGYLAILGAFARTQEDPQTVLRSLISPETDPARFSPVFEQAEREWRSCRRSRAP